jgi:DNA gyrase subunit A
MSDIDRPLPFETPHPVDIEEEMKRSYLDYAMSVIIGRALPDVRDGLKPVHRRVLYGMWESGNLSNRAYKKSARIVGDVMGKYHPHGDAPIYDTVVRMAQDFSMRYPLVDGQGNFGSIDGDNPAAMRYCVTGDTLVATPRGPVRIDAIVPGARPESDNEIDLEVIDRFGQPVHASMLFHSGDHPTLHLRTTAGQELTGTMNHPVLCLLGDAGLPVVMWKLLGEIRPGDLVVRMPTESRGGEQDWPYRHEPGRVERWAQRGTATLERIASSAVQETVATLVTGHCLYAEVESVTDAGIQPVYSIRVDTDDHSFLTNGFVSHNTEVRLTKLAEEMLRDDIDKETVDWVPNYDGSLQEPVVLPARVPNLLINGSSGIAVGMATNIPPHNLGEVIDALVLLIDQPDAGLDKIMRVLPGPDFPTAGFIHGLTGIQAAYRDGRGIIQVRGRAGVETQRRGDWQSIVITEIPYQVNKARLIERIAELVHEKKLDGITDLRDESDRDGIRIVLDVRRGEVPEVLINQLYKNTQMQMTFGIILLAIVDNQPKVLKLHEMLRYYLDHRKTVVVRRTRYDLRKAEERAHVLEGILKALDHLDEVITTIRSSQTPLEARDRLMSGFSLSEVQAQAILEMRLQRLTGLEREKVVAEYKELVALIERLRAILASDQLVLAEIRRELLEVKEVFADKRRTEIIPETHEITIEDMIADEDMVITVSSSGYVKRSPLSLYRAQHRGGKGRTGMTIKEEDFVEHLYVASAHSYVLTFTESGRVHWIKVHEIPQAGPAAKGKAIVNLLNIDPSERLATTVTVRDFPEDRYLVFATEKGTIKKTVLSAFGNPRAGGIIAINIEKGDRLLDVRMTDGEKEILLATQNGFAIRFKESDARPMGRDTTGVRGIRLRKGDRVVGMEALATAAEGDIFTVTARAYGKRSAVEAYRLQSRGGMGVINLKVVAKTGPVVGVKQVRPEDGAVLITQSGKIIRINVEGVRVIGRSTQGVKLMDLEDDDRLVAVAKVAEREDREGEAGAGEAPEPPPETVH